MKEPTSGTLQSRRWKCPHCKTEGWSRDGLIPDHYRAAGGHCRRWKADLDKAKVLRAPR